MATCTAGFAKVQAMANWHVNFVRVLINEQCWLGINGVPAAYGGANYRNAIVNYVNLLHQHGMYAEISLMWAAPGTTRATYNPQMPDADHAPAARFRLHANCRSAGIQRVLK